MAVRIVGVDIPQNKRGVIALTYIFGIGRSSAATILKKAGVDENTRVKDWTDAEAAAVREVIGNEYKVEGDLRSEVQMNIKRLMDIGCYRGIRHLLNNIIELWLKRQSQQRRESFALTVLVNCTCILRSTTSLCALLTARDR